MEQDINQNLVEIAQQHKGTRAADKAIEQLIKLNGGLIWQVVRKLMSGMEFSYKDDMLSVCHISILKALDSYQFGNKAKFVTWWVIQMRAGIQAWRRAQSGELYLEQCVRDKKFQINYYKRIGNVGALKSGLKKIAEFESYKDVEIENRYDDDTYEIDLKETTLNLGGLMGLWSINGLREVDNGLHNIYKLFDSNNIELKNKLNKRDIKILEYRFIQGLKYHQIGELMNYSKEHIRKELTKAFIKIEHAIELNNTQELI